MDSRRLFPRCSFLLTTLMLIAAAPAQAGRVSVQVEGLDDPLQAAALAGLQLQQYVDREVSPAQVRRLYRSAPAEIGKALEPYGYYNATVSGELNTEGDTQGVQLKVELGPPTLVSDLDIRIDGDTEGLKAVDKARSEFIPYRKQPLVHAEYEASKAAIQSALVGAGYLDARLVTHRVAVERATHSARIELEWQVGERYRLAGTTFTGSQFDEGFLQRFIHWDVGDYYAQDELLALQQRLFDSGYFSLSQVEPDLDAAHDGEVPIRVTLAPAKRTLYTGGVFFGTDTGAGVRAGINRRWVNRKGHKLDVETVLAQRLKTASTFYRVPLPGRNNHSRNFGISYRDENTKTSESQTLRLAANDSRLWHGWTSTLGLQFLTGDFKVAEQKGNTTLLYPEWVLTKKHADDFNFPRHGWSLTLAARAGEEALLSDTRFAQIGADAKWIQGLGEHGRFIARGSAGFTQVDDFDKLPPELRFFAGGDRSIRGYTFQTIGPRRVVEGEAEPQVIGGSRLLVGSAEYEHFFTPNWGAAVFVDAGDAFSGKDFDLKVGAGLGLRWRSPVGLVRVDLGTPIGDPYASGIELHVVIGPDL